MDPSTRRRILDPMGARDEPLEVLYDASAIAAAVARLARDVGRALGGREALAVPVMNGGLFFAADLLRALEGTGAVGAVAAAVASSHPDGAFPAGAPTIATFPSATLVAGRVVLLIDTVVDSGSTVHALAAAARERGASEVRVVCLADKPARRRAPIAPDWSGFRAPDRYLVGYGLDVAGRLRSLPHLAALPGAFPAES
jgi:hypoxanthine phosphoribosyltransferase